MGFGLVSPGPAVVRAVAAHVGAALHTVTVFAVAVANVAAVVEGFPMTLFLTVFGLTGFSLCQIFSLLVRELVRSL